MQVYKQILLAVALVPESDSRIVQKAEEFAKQFNANLVVLHVVERLTSYGAAYGVAVGADVEQMLLDSAKKVMSNLQKKLGLSADRCLVKVGPPSVVILEESEHLKADLIVLGSHGKHGIRLLLGSTANAVLHGAKCDVLAVRLQK